MNERRHDSLIAEQFGPRAQAYVTSAVHAEGDDLRYLADIVRRAAPARLLDLGCGGGHVSFNAAPFAREVTAYDLSPAMLDAVAAEAARRGLTNIRCRQGAVEKLPFGDDEFEMVLARYSAHHWRDLAGALAEARRVLKPGGRAVFADVVSPGLGLLDTYLQSVELLRDPSHARDYSVEEWCSALTAAGFTLGAVTPRRLRLEFASWTARMATPEVQASAIRALQKQMADEVVRHFAIEADGSFTLDTATIEAGASG